MNLEQITSRENRRLVDARKVRDGKVEGKMFIEGRRLAREALRSEIIIQECFLSDDFDDEELRDTFHGPVYEIPANIFRSIADTGQPQGIILIAKRPNTGPLFIKAASNVPVVLFLSEVNNPSNLGAVIRAAEAAGAAGVIVSRNSADVFSPKALRSAMGSSFRVPIWQDAEFEKAIVWANEKGLITTASDVAGGHSYTDVNWKEARMLILGSEAHGLGKEQLGEVDEKISIPMENGVESLNLAVAAGVILYEAKRQNTP